MRKHEPAVASSVSTGFGAGFVGLCSIQLSYGCKATGNTPTASAAQGAAPKKHRQRGGTLIDRVSARIDTSAGIDACWPWTGRFDWYGYGLVNHGRLTRGPHRVVLAAVLGRDLGPDEVTRHRCNNRACCNPRHLQPGTKADNTADMIAADRHARGERSPNAKLTDDDVMEMRTLAADMGHGRYSSLGRLYGVSANCASRVVRGLCWAHVGASR